MSTCEDRANFDLYKYQTSSGSSAKKGDDVSHKTIPQVPLHRGAECEESWDDAVSRSVELCRKKKV